jgi:hypothetical protein
VKGTIALEAAEKEGEAAQAKLEALKGHQAAGRSVDPERPKIVVPNLVVVVAAVGSEPPVEVPPVASPTGRVVAVVAW